MRHLRHTWRRRIGGRAAVPALLAGCVLACLAFAPGCDSSTAPEDDAFPLWFEPRGGSASVPLGEHLDFQVAGPGAAEAEVSWTSARHGEAAGVRYRYRADFPADDELRAVVRSHGRTSSHVWRIDVAPGGQDVLAFSPAAAEPPVFVDLLQVFAVTSPWGTPTVGWSLDGAPQVAGSEFPFTAAAVGRRELTVTAALGDTTVVRTWTLDVRPLAEALPGRVVGLEALPGSRRGEIRLAWSAAAAGAFPLTHYEVRVSTTGPVTAETWDGLPALPIVQVQAGLTAYTTAIPPHLTGLAGGETVWCAVRGRDDRNLLAPPEAVETVAVDGRWWAAGRVRDHLGVPVAGLTVATAGGGPSAATAADGAYALGPFEMTESPVLVAAPPVDDAWHTARSHPRGPDATDWDFLVLPRWGCDPSCTGFDGHFMAFLRNLTGTYHPTEDRPNTNLYRWESWPVPVHVPDFVSTGGVDYGAACRAMVQAWNDNLGGEYLTLVPGPLAGGIVFAYDLDSTGLHGLAKMVQPGNGSLPLGSAPPELVTLRMQPALPSGLAVQAVALHELGHALGLYAHAVCAGPGYLMWLGGINPFERPPAESIHEDEIRAVQLIRALPQGLEMAAYPTED